MENIGLQDSLLSRFDLLFIVLDIVSYLIGVCGHISEKHVFFKKPSPLDLLDFIRFWALLGYLDFL